MDTVIYQDYIDLGFERTNTEDDVEFRETGYHGFYLEKILNSKISIYVSSSELDTPKLYIKKSIGDTYHIIKITGDIVRDLLRDKANGDVFNCA